MEPTLDRLFIDFSTQKLQQYSAEIRKCFALLSDSQIWERGGPHENAIGNLVLHLCGNVRQRIAAIAGRGDDRIREQEFSATGGTSGAHLMELLDTTTRDAVSTMSVLSAERLRERVVTGDFNQTVLESIYHMELHFALHSGQIFFATKRLCGEGLGFYKPPVAEKHA
jgi:Protein of unknown function (DUF1572)